MLVEQWDKAENGTSDNDKTNASAYVSVLRLMRMSDLSELGQIRRTYAGGTRHVQWEGVSAPLGHGRRDFALVENVYDAQGKTEVLVHLDFRAGILSEMRALSIELRHFVVNASSQGRSFLVGVDCGVSEQEMLVVVEEIICDELTSSITTQVLVKERLPQGTVGFAVGSSGLYTLCRDDDGSSFWVTFYPYKGDAAKIPLTQPIQGSVRGLRYDSWGDNLIMWGQRQMLIYSAEEDSLELRADIAIDQAAISSASYVADFERMAVRASR